ncbi:MAG: hypothetical protein HQ543_02740 [Bacteroidetes bacterium]|nr:hypothetical protein [Bacteroidota bacterium]
MKNQTIYVLSKVDAQNVAQQEIGRKLTSYEIQRIKDSIADKINWYDAIADAINENISIAS